MHRRGPHRATLVAALLAALSLLGASPAWGLNPIQLENELPGTTAWQLPGATPTTIPTASSAIDGYASQISVAPGDTLKLHISTQANAAYRIEIYRLGWYGGAGGRLITCLPSCTGSEPGTARPVPAPDPSTGELDAGWPASDSVAITPAWVSGYYLAKLVLATGAQAGHASQVPFIVRAPAGAHSAMLVQASVNTWEAYNNWGGKSLYTINSSGPVVPASKTVAAAMVSFNRPFAPDWNTTPLSWEYGLVRFLERRGYDVSYTTDADTDLNPSSLLGHTLDVVNGHDEYWSPTMRNAWEAARAAGVNESFIGGNIGYWQARYADADRTLVEYRQASLDPEPDPALKTVPFSTLSPPRPECTLLGVGYPGGLAKPGDPARPYTVTPAAASNPWFRNTGLSPGATIADAVGYEWDTLKPGCAPPSAQVLLHYAGRPANADAVAYTAPSGAQVFSDGTMQLTWALDDYGHPPHADTRVQALFANLFNALGAPPAGSAPPVPGPLSPIANHWTAARTTFTWSPNAVGPETFTVAVDGRTVGTLDSSACAPTGCALTARVTAGRHVWQVLASDPLGGESAAAVNHFRVDATAPAGFALRAPAAQARLFNPRPALRWRRSSDRGSGLAGYDVEIDGKLVAFTRATSYTPPHGLSDGRHRWLIIAVDRVGNQRRSAQRTFRIASVRVLGDARAGLLGGGLRLAAFCPRACTVTVSVAQRTQVLSTSPAHRFHRGGIERLTVVLAPATRRRLRAAHGQRLSVVVVIAVGHARRTVTLTVQL